MWRTGRLPRRGKYRAWCSERPTPDGVTSITRFFSLPGSALLQPEDLPCTSLAWFPDVAGVPDSGVMSRAERLSVHVFVYSFRGLALLSVAVIALAPLRGGALGDRAEALGRRRSSARAAAPMWRLLSRRLQTRAMLPRQRARRRLVRVLHGYVGRLAVTVWQGTFNTDHRNTGRVFAEAASVRVMSNQRRIPCL